MSWLGHVAEFMRQHSCADDDLLRRICGLVQRAVRETRCTKHAVKFGEGVSIAAGGGREHDKRESRRHWRRDAIFVGDELERDQAATGAKSRAEATEKSCALLRVEVVEQIGEEDDVVGAFEVDGECIARKSGVAIADAHLCCMALRDFEDLGPVERSDFEIGIFLSEDDAKKPMARGDVEHSTGSRAEQTGDGLSSGEHHRAHFFGEGNPAVVFRGDGAGVFIAAAADGIGECGEKGCDGSVDEAEHAANVGGRLAIKEHRSFGSEGVGVRSFGEQVLDCPIVAEDADTFWGCVAGLSDLRGC